MTTTDAPGARVKKERAPRGGARKVHADAAALDRAKLEYEQALARAPDAGNPAQKAERDAAEATYRATMKKLGG